MLIYKLGIWKVHERPLKNWTDAKEKHSTFLAKHEKSNHRHTHNTPFASIYDHRSFLYLCRLRRTRSLFQISKLISNASLFCLDLHCTTLILYIWTYTVWYKDWLDFLYFKYKIGFKFAEIFTLFHEQIFLAIYFRRLNI